MNIYMDNCCYNRPYDDQTQLRVSLECQAKLYIQRLVRDEKVELTDSYILHYENTKNPFEVKRQEIRSFIDSYRSHFVDAEQSEVIKSLAEEIKESGVKDMDALHVACAIYGECDCFLTTDKRLLKYKTDKIKIQNPITFFAEWEEEHHDD